MLSVMSHVSTTTQIGDAGTHAEQVPAVPGVLVMFANQRPRFRVLRWAGTPLELGRVELAEDDVHDTLISRKHVRLRFDGSRWLVADLASRNGTFVAGQALSGEVAVAAGTIVR